MGKYYNEIGLFIFERYSLYPLLLISRKAS